MRIKHASEAIRLVTNARGQEQFDSGVDLDEDDQELEARRNRWSFESSALKFAQTGLNYVVMSDHGINFEDLKREGFEVRELIKSDAMLKALKDAMEDAEFRTSMLADKLLAEQPGFKVNEISGLLHRNPLLSLINSMWSRGEITETTSTSEFERALQGASNATDDWLNSHRFVLKAIVDEYKTLRLAQLQYGPVAQDHSMIPVGLQKAICVDWGSVVLDGTVTAGFSPKLLRWFSKYWGDLVDWLSNSVGFAAERGLHFAQFLISESEDGFDFYDELESADLLTVHPFPMRLLHDELLAAGYKLKITLRHYDPEEAKYREEVVGNLGDVSLDGNLTCHLEACWM